MFKVLYMTSARAGAVGSMANEIELIVLKKNRSNDTYSNGSVMILLV